MDNKTTEKLQKLLSLLPAFQFHLQGAAKIQREIASIKLPLKKGRPKK